MSSAQREVEIRTWAGERRLAGHCVDRWLGLEVHDRDALLELAKTLRLRTGQFVIIFELLEEIAVRENQKIAEIVARHEISRILESNQSAPGKAKAFLDVLRLIRFPRLRAALDGITARIAALKLPPGVRIVLPPDLGSDELRMEVTAHGGAELKRAVDALTVKRAELCRIADLLGGADEI